ncbi:MAG: CapA family protein [Clostridia bacterium]|nr:CapA family protein [Clostridia bacterium]
MKTLFMGDMSPTVATDPLFEKMDVKALFHDVPTLFDKSDLSFVNLECALTDSENAIKKFGPNLKAHKNTAEVLKMIGTDICGLSNNHIFDFGIEGAVDTIKALDEADILYTGFGENYDDSRKDLIIELDGEKIAIVAVCEHEYSYALEDRMGSRPFDEFDTMLDIRDVREKADRVVVIYHGGKEHCRYPSPRLRKLSRAMIKHGADLVICQHSHCIGCYEEFMGGHILYGQGNFHFVKADFLTPALVPTWNNCLAVEYDTKKNEVNFVPIVVKDYGIELAKGEERKAIMKAFYERNEELKDGRWNDGWHAFCESVKEGYINNIGNAGRADSTEQQNAVFGHYLDCEAHTDVWRELFPTYNLTNEKEEK